MTSSAEKNRAEENEAKRNLKQTQKDQKHIESVKRVVQLSSNPIQQDQQNQYRKAVRRKKNMKEVASFHESDIEIPYVDSDQSDGSFVEESTLSETDDESYAVEDFVFVKLKPTFYVEEIIEKFRDVTFNTNFLEDLILQVGCLWNP